MIRQDPTAWKAGYRAGWSAAGDIAPDTCPDRLAWQSGYVEGAGDRKRARIVAAIPAIRGKRPRKPREIVSAARSAAARARWDRLRHDPEARSQATAPARKASRARRPHLPIRTDGDTIRS